MSRCFPFPPPRYERKIRVEDDNLLAQEKDRKKKHRKDKEEKKEGREKDKERSKERHKEKDKQKKEKHKHKDKDKKKDKKRSRDEKRSEGERSIVEKVGSNSPESNEVRGISSVQELGRRIGYADTVTGSLSVHFINDGNGNQGKADLLERVAGSNNSCLSEGKSGFRYDGRTKSPKLAFGCNFNGTAEIARPMENIVFESMEGKEKQKRHRSDKNGEKNKDKTAKRREGQAGICTREKSGNNGALVDPPEETVFVQELGRRIRNENGAIGSQVSAEANISSQIRAQCTGKLVNGYASYSSQAKGSSIFGNGSYRMENGQKDDNRSRGLKVSIVHNFKMLDHRGCEVAGDMGASKEAQIEGTTRNQYSGNDAIDNKEKKILPKDEARNKPRNEKVKQGGADCVVKHSSFGESGSDSTYSSKLYDFKVENNRAVGGTTGKRKKPEANGFLDENEKRPNKWQRTVLSCPQASESGRKLHSCTTLTLSASQQEASNRLNLDSEKHIANRIMGSQSPLGSSKSRSTITKSDVTVHAQSPLSTSNPPSTSVKANGAVRAHESPLGPARPSLSTKVDGTIGAQKSSLILTKPPCTTAKAKGAIGTHGPPLVSTELSPTSLSGKSSVSVTRKHKDKSSSKSLLPHPDSKYLSWIFSVPNMDELPEFDDPEWLFDHKSSSSKEADVGCMQGEGDHQVWSKVVHLSAEVYALPYVIPY